MMNEWMHGWMNDIIIDPEIKNENIFNSKWFILQYLANHWTVKTKALNHLRFCEKMWKHALIKGWVAL